MICIGNLLGHVHARKFVLWASVLGTCPLLHGCGIPEPVDETPRPTTTVTLTREQRLQYMEMINLAEELRRPEVADEDSAEGKPPDR